MNVVLCDDHTLLLDALGQALSRRGIAVVAAVDTLAEAERAIARYRPDACLLDLSFPEGSGLEAVAALRAAHPATKVVILSGSTNRSVVTAAIRGGVDGFIGKDRPVDEVVHILQRAVDGDVAIAPELLRRSFAPSRPEDDPLWMVQFLTRREWEVSRCIVDGLATDDIAQRLGIRRSTARTHVQHLLTKLGVHSRLQAMQLLTAAAAIEEVSRILGGQ